MKQRLKQEEKQKAEAAVQDQIKDKTQTQTTGQTQLGTQRQTAMQGHRDADGQGTKQEEQQHQQREQEQSQIHDDWFKICKAISSLSDGTLDNCVNRLNDSVFNKLYKSYEIKDDVSIETFDIIMNEIDDDVKTQHIDKEIRQFITKPVMEHLCFGLIVLLFCCTYVCVLIV